MRKVTLTVSRYQAGSYSHGSYSRGSLDETFSVSGSLQPLAGEEREALPSGIRRRAEYKFYALYGQRTIRPVDPSSNLPGDVVTYGSVDYVVHQDKNYEIQTFGRRNTRHHRYILIADLEA